MQMHGDLPQANPDKIEAVVIKITLGMAISTGRSGHLGRIFGSEGRCEEVWEVWVGVGNRDGAAGASGRCQGAGSNTPRDAWGCS